MGKNIGLAPFRIDDFYPELITIKNNSSIGWRVNILTHEFTNEYFKFGKVVIEQNVLIGAFSTIRCGVTIGKNSIVAMGSLVLKDIPPNEVWGGVPAKKLMNKEDYFKIKRKDL